MLAIDNVNDPAKIPIIISTFSQNKAKKKNLFPEMRVAKKIFTRAAAKKKKNYQFN